MTSPSSAPSSARLRSLGRSARRGAGTVYSAFTLTWAGRLIDLTTVKRATGCIAALLSVACLLAAAAMHGVMLGVACVFLRPCGARSCIMRAAV
jgi:hypothetical protein